METKKKYLETLQTNISNNYCETLKQTCIFKQRNLFNSLIHSSLAAYYKSRNTGTWNIGGTLAEQLTFDGTSNF